MKKWTVVVACALLIALLVAASPVLAGSTKTPVEFFEVSCLVDPGVIWNSGKDGKMLHVRGQLVENTLYDPPTEAAVGMNHAVANIDLNTATGNGEVSGTFSSYFDADPEGTFDGTFNGKISEFTEFLGKAVGQGTGTLKGQKLKSTLLLIDPFSLPPAILSDLPCDFSEIVGVYYDEGFIHSRGN